MGDYPNIDIWLRKGIGIAINLEWQVCLTFRIEFPLIGIYIRFQKEAPLFGFYNEFTE